MNIQTKDLIMKVVLFALILSFGFSAQASIWDAFSPINKTKVYCVKGKGNKKIRTLKGKFKDRHLQHNLRAIKAKCKSDGGRIETECTKAKCGQG